MDKQLQLKEKIKEQYGKIALDGNSNSCCMPSADCCSTHMRCSISPFDIIKSIGYDSDKLKSDSRIISIGSRMWKSHKICRHKRRKYRC